ncbi:MAG TPA: class I SAM-dependent methyltransferase [Vicinamibacterales bacterium]|nr:class I SAM-dependent methyltransferase [Vicinamibacterales bacterium]
MQTTGAAAPPPTAEGTPPSPAAIFDCLHAFQHSYALKAAIDLDLFTVIAEGAATVEAAAARCGGSARGVRILCDGMAMLGFLTKSEDGRYALTPDSALFLARTSPAYVGTTADFLLAPDQMKSYESLADIIRHGKPDVGGLAPEHPMWVTFARSMAPMMAMPAQLLAGLLDVAHGGPMKVLDVAAGHGLFGIAVARQNPQAEIVAADWAPVLEVARENAAKAGVSDRYRMRPGNALTGDLGSGYDLVLLTNFLHHFSEADCTTFLTKIRTVLRDGGRVAALEFVPDENRLTPPVAARFSLTMLAATPGGDAYTFGQYRRMFGDAGFRDIGLRPLPPSFERVVTGVR